MVEVALAVALAPDSSSILALVASPLEASLDDELKELVERWWLFRATWMALRSLISSLDR